MGTCSCDYGSSKSDNSDGVFFSAMLTPPAILDIAQVGEKYFLTSKGEIQFKTGAAAHTRLLRIPLAKQGNLDTFRTIVVNVVVSHRSLISPTADMDPYFMLSDGVSSVGMKMHDKDNFRHYSPIVAVEGQSGTRLGSPSQTAEDLRVTSTPATVHYLHFRLEPNRRAQCFAHASYDREISLYHQYSKVLHPERGLFFEVYRDDTKDQYVFSFFQIHAQAE
jgi:hypothetical protein